MFLIVYPCFSRRMPYLLLFPFLCLPQSKTDWFQSAAGALSTSLFPLWPLSDLLPQALVLWIKNSSKFLDWNLRNAINLPENNENLLAPQNKNAPKRFSLCQRGRKGLLAGPNKILSANNDVNGAGGRNSSAWDCYHSNWSLSFWLGWDEGYS